MNVKLKQILQKTLLLKIIDKNIINFLFVLYNKFIIKYFFYFLLNYPSKLNCINCEFYKNLKYFYLKCIDDY